MKKYILLLPLVLISISCSKSASKASSQAAEPDPYQFAIENDTTNVHDVGVQVLDAPEFTLMEFYIDECTAPNLLSQFTNVQLQTRQILTTTNDNATTDIYYKVFNGVDELTDCKFYMSHTHDNIQPTGTLDSTPTLVNDPNESLEGDCESPGDVVLSGDTNATVSCVNDRFSVQLDLPNEGANSVTISFVDSAGNTQTSTLTINLDSVDPTPPVLVQTLLDRNNTATEDTSVQIEGTQVDSENIIVYNGLSDPSPQTINYADFVAGQVYTLNSDSINNLYIRAVDSAGNLSTPVLVSISQTTTPVYSYSLQISQGGSYTGNAVTNAEYRKRITLQNSSTEDSSGYQIPLSGVTLSTTSTDVSIDSNSECLTASFTTNSTCELILVFKYASSGNKSDLIEATFPDASSQNLTITWDSVVDLVIGDTGAVDAFSGSAPYIINTKSVTDRSAISNSMIYAYNADLTQIFDLNDLRECETGSIRGEADMVTGSMLFYKYSDLATPFQTLSSTALIQTGDETTRRFGCLETQNVDLFYGLNSLFYYDKVMDTVGEIDLSQALYPKNLFNLLAGSYFEKSMELLFVSSNNQSVDTDAVNNRLYELDLSDYSISEIALPANFEIHPQESIVATNDSYIDLYGFISSTTSIVRYSFTGSTFSTIHSQSGLDFMPVDIHSNDHFKAKVKIEANETPIYNVSYDRYIIGSDPKIVVDMPESTCVLVGENDTSFFSQCIRGGDIPVFEIDKTTGSINEVLANGSFNIVKAYMVGDKVVSTPNFGSTIHVRSLDGTNDIDFTLPTSGGGSAAFVADLIRDDDKVYIYVQDNDGIDIYYVSEEFNEPMLYLNDVASYPSFSRSGVGINNGRFYISKSSASDVRSVSFPLIIE